MVYCVQRIRGEPSHEYRGDEKGGSMKEDMTRLELLTLLLSIKALLESDNKEKALELIDEVIKEAKK
jgi:hypothetical protein